MFYYKINTIRCENCNNKFVIVISFTVAFKMGHSFYFSDYRKIDFENVSMFLFPNTIWLREPIDEIIIKSVIVSIVVIIGIIGNVSYLILLCKYRILRTETNILIGNMAVADSFQLLLCSWIYLISSFYQNFVLGYVVCKMEGFLICSLLLTSILTLCVISYDRLIVMTLPKWNRLNRTKTFWLISLTWSIGIGLSVPLIFYKKYRIRQWLNFCEKYCTEVGKLSDLYWHILLAFIVWIPLTFMLICYIAIFIKLRQYHKKMLYHKNPVLLKYKAKVTITMFIIVVTFIVCRVPFTAIIFLRGTLGTNQNSVTPAMNVILFVSNVLIFINAALNPFIYGYTNERIRRILASDLKMKCCISLNSANKDAKNGEQICKIGLSNENIEGIYNKKSKT